MNLKKIYNKDVDTAVQLAQQYPNDCFVMLNDDNQVLIIHRTKIVGINLLPSGDAYVFAQNIIEQIKLDKRDVAQFIIWFNNRTKL